MIITIASKAIPKIRPVGIHKGEVTHHHDQLATTPTCASFNPRNKRNNSIGKLKPELVLDFDIRQHFYFIPILLSLFSLFSDLVKKLYFGQNRTSDNEFIPNSCLI